MQFEKRIQLMKGSKYPLIKLDFCIGNKMRVIRLPHEQPVIIAASSISPDNCNMALVPLRDANGRNLIPPTMIQIATADASFIDVVTSRNLNASVLITDRNIAPKLREGIRYGRNAKLETRLANLL